MSTTRALPALFACLALAACAPKFYSANSLHVPLLDKAGSGTASATVNPNGSSADLHGSYAVTNNVGFQANAALYFPKDEDSTGNGGNGGLFEVGMGYFRPVVTNVIFETYGLLAFGGLENHFPQSVSGNPGTDGKLNANLVRVALQPALGYKHRYVEVAVSSRIAMLNYFNIGGDLVTGGENQQQYLRDNRIQFVADPALILRGGLPRLKAELQIGQSYNLGNPDFPQDKGWGSLGVVYHFDPPR